MADSDHNNVNAEHACAVGRGLAELAQHGDPVTQQWYGLLSDLFQRGVNGCSAEDQGERHLAGLRTVEVFLKKIEDVGGAEMRSIQAATSRGESIDDASSQALQDAFPKKPIWDRLNGYEAELLIKHYLPSDHEAKYRQELGKQAQEKISRRRVSAVLGMVGAGGMLWNGRSFFNRPEKPEMMPEQQCEIDAARYHQDIVRTRNTVAYTPMHDRTKWENVLQAFNEEAGEAFTAWKKAEHQRVASGLPHFEEALKTWEGKQLSIFDYVGLISGVVAFGSGGLGMVITSSTEDNAQSMIDAYGSDAKHALAKAVHKLAIGIEPLLKNAAEQTARSRILRETPDIRMN